MATAFGYVLDELIVPLIRFAEALDDHADVINATLGISHELISTLDEYLIILRCECSSILIDCCQWHCDCDVAGISDYDELL